MRWRTISFIAYKYLDIWYYSPAAIFLWLGDGNIMVAFEPTLMTKLANPLKGTALEWSGSLGYWFFGERKWQGDLRSFESSGSAEFCMVVWIE